MTVTKSFASCIFSFLVPLSHYWHSQFLCFVKITEEGLIKYLQSYIEPKEFYIIYFNEYFQNFYCFISLVRRQEAKLRVT